MIQIKVRHEQFWLNCAVEGLAVKNFNPKFIATKAHFLKCKHIVIIYLL